MLGDLNVIPLAETQIALLVKLMERPEEVFFPNEGKELLIYFPKIIYVQKWTQVCFQIVFTVFQHDILSQLLKLSLHLNAVVQNLISTQKNTKKVT